MSIKSDRWIRRMAASHRMIEPFESSQIYANEGVAQVIFFESDPDDVCETSYKDRGGKYQGQKGVTLPKI